MILEVRRLSAPAVIVVLLRDVDINLLSEFRAGNPNVGESFAVIDQENRKVHQVVGSGQVVIVMENIEDQDSQPFPLLDREEPVSTFFKKDIKSRACIPHDLVVRVQIKGRFSPQKYSNPGGLLCLENINDRLNLPSAEIHAATKAVFGVHTFESGIASSSIGRTSLGWAFPTR